MILALLLLAAPSELSLQVGSSVEAPIQLAPDAQLLTQHPLEIQSHNQTHAQLTTNAKPGTYQAHLYAAPKSNDTILAATGEPITVNVRATKKTAHIWLLTTASLLATISYAGIYARKRFWLSHN